MTKKERKAKTIETIEILVTLMGCTHNGAGFLWTTLIRHVVKLYEPIISKKKTKEILRVLSAYEEADIRYTKLQEKILEILKGGAK